MAIVSIVYHSGYGHTKVIADAVLRGVSRVEGVTAKIYTAAEAIELIAELDSSDAIIFGSPTYMSGPSADFKAFTEKTAGRWFQQAWKDKIAGGFTNSGSISGDKLATLQYFASFALSHGMVWVGQAELAPNHDGKHGGQPEDVNRGGFYLGVGTQADNVDASVSPPSGDIRTAEIYGERVARATLRWNR